MPWQATRAGLPGDANAVNKSAQVNQLLTGHPSNEIYRGNQILTPAGTGGYFSFIQFPQNDWDQPFTMSGTTVGRVTIPIMPVGKGADLQVSLCADNAGVPGTVIASSRIPANWITSFASTDGSMSGPLQVPQFNTLQFGPWTTVKWNLPSTSATGNPNPTTIVSGNYMILVGGSDSVSGADIPNVYTIAYQGGSTLGFPVPQPSIPQAAHSVCVGATADTLIAAGGATTAVFSNVFAANWNPATGQVSSWSAQASLPQPLYAATVVTNGSTVYVIGGINATTDVNTVYYATVQNGQIQSWNTGPSLPAAAHYFMCAVLGNRLMVAGGKQGSSYLSGTYYAAINADGSLGTWQPGPNLPVATSGLNWGVTPNGFIDAGGQNATTALQAITGNSAGLGDWQRQTYPSGTPGGQAGLFPRGTGTWQFFLVNATSYNTATLYAVPRISVPLPATGLTNGAKYHVVMHQVGGDLNNYLTGAIDASALPLNPQYRNTGSSTWTAYPGFQVPITVHDLSVGGPPLHTWEDGGARISTLVYATTGDQRLLGVAEATQFADGTMFSDVAALTYPGTWPAGAWPPLGVTQIA